jgi:hypothetical protein
MICLQHHPQGERLRGIDGWLANTMERISAIFTHLFHEGREAEMMAILRILYDLSGLKFPEDVELLADHPEARQYFLFSFLMDMEDCMQNFISEAAGE